MAQVWKFLPCSAWKVSPPTVGTGASEKFRVESPSWPTLLPPQQYASPAVVRPQEWKKPLETSLKLSPPYTAVGLEREVWEESPSLPSRLSPQQYPVPALVMPQDRKYPALRVSNCRLVRTGAGNLCGVVLERSEEHTSELQSHSDLVCRLLLEKKKKTLINTL